MFTKRLSSPRIIHDPSQQALPFPTCHDILQYFEKTFALTSNMGRNLVSRKADVTPRSVETLDRLLTPGTVKSSGGVVTLNVSDSAKSKVAKTYRKAMEDLDALKFWRDGAKGRYRPCRGL